MISNLSVNEMRRQTSSPSIRSYAINWRKRSIIHSVTVGIRTLGPPAA